MASRALVAAAAILFASLACSLHKDPTLVDGRSLTTLASADSTAVVIADPGDCFACDQLLYSVLEARRRRPGAVALVLSRVPSEAERRRIVIARHLVDGVLASRPRWTGGTPIVLVGVEGQSPVLKSLKNARPLLAALLRSPRPASDSLHPRSSKSR